MSVSQTIVSRNVTPIRQAASKPIIAISLSSPESIAFSSFNPLKLCVSAHPERNHEHKDYKRYGGHRKHHNREVRIIKGLADRLVLIVGRQG